MAREPLMITDRQLLYLHELSKKVGKHETYEELELLTRSEARKIIYKYRLQIEKRKP